MPIIVEAGQVADKSELSRSGPLNIPDVIETGLPGQRFDSGTSFPLVLHATSAIHSHERARDWAARYRDLLLQQCAEHGAILFRGFPLTDHLDFDAFVAAFDLPNFRYEDSLSNAVRVVKTERVFTANEAPADVRIVLHHEMAQTPVFPSALFFFCEQPADEGGETPVCRSDILFARMQQELPEFAARCTELGLRYSHTMPAANDTSSGMGRSWQSTLRATDQNSAEQRLRSLGYTWTWMPDGCLQVRSPQLPAVRALSNGGTAFFNQLIASFHGWKDARNDPSKSVTFGDGTPLDPQTMQHVITMAEELTFNIPWQAGDVALVDNYVAMHGRRTFKGTRRVLASLIR